MPVEVKRPAIRCLALGILLLAVLASPAWASSAEGEHDEGGGGIVSPEWGTSLFTIIVFVVLMAILYKWAWPPLIDALEGRQNRIEGDLADADKARQDAEALQADWQQKLDEARAEARQLVEEARAEATRQQEELLVRAREEAQAMVDRAHERIRQETDQALVELYAKTASLATEVASRIVGRALNPQDHETLINQVLDQYGGRSAGNN